MTIGCLDDCSGIKNVSFCELIALTSQRMHILIQVQGGRLVTERKMVSDMYVFDLETFIWERLLPVPGDEVPGARYFHSADTCKAYFYAHMTRLLTRFN